MPSKGTQVRTLRVEDEVWQPAKRRAADEGRTIGAVLREFLIQYGDAQPERSNES
jgi:hypothetical protein